jgi:hypothetical protein
VSDVRAEGRGAMTYYVVNWNTDAVISSHDKLPEARRVAKAQGSEPADPRYFTGDHPIAFVRNEDGSCAYNPKFKHGEK